ncbi:hypothetical protein CDV31_016604 [Fusarium ambrosium]|uniref:Uncharacterized protein n=1 Tax=Fusarium ambrosium TaxID=131363 RepID=A0A428S5T0_9HYPO|nr:hypothetical protein CDV31_016604 [Fusarium ambrosium]
MRRGLHSLQKRLIGVCDWILDRPTFLHRVAKEYSAGPKLLWTPSPILILTFNIAFDTSIFPGERHHISLAGCYQLLCYTGARPAELVDGERKKPKDGTVEELFGHKVVQSSFSEDGDDPVR